MHSELFITEAAEAKRKSEAEAATPDDEDAQRRFRELLNQPPSSGVSICICPQV